jgi:hypothetical protein
LTAPAPGGNAVVNLASANPAATVPTSVTIAVGNASTSFTVTTSSVSATTIGNISASYAGVTKSATLTVNPAPAVTLQSLTLNPTTVTGGATSTGTVTLSADAPAGGAEVALYSSRPLRASVPAKVTVAAG